eukprot:scaffold47993_cov56-Phaeocystis_antarctica.AAC.1
MTSAPSTRATPPRPASSTRSTTGYGRGPSARSAWAEEGSPWCSTDTHFSAVLICVSVRPTAQRRTIVYGKAGGVHPNLVHASYTHHAFYRSTTCGSARTIGPRRPLPAAESMATSRAVLEAAFSFCARVTGAESMATARPPLPAFCVWRSRSYYKLTID